MTQEIIVTTATYDQRDAWFPHYEFREQAICHFWDCTTWHEPLGQDGGAIFLVTGTDYTRIDPPGRLCCERHLSQEVLDRGSCEVRLARPGDERWNTRTVEDLKEARRKAGFERPATNYRDDRELVSR